jgi:hypothetical protein
MCCRAPSSSSLSGFQASAAPFPKAKKAANVSLRESGLGRARHRIRALRGPAGGQPRSWRTRRRRRRSAVLLHPRQARRQSRSRRHRLHARGRRRGDEREIRHSLLDIAAPNAGRDGRRAGRRDGYRDQPRPFRPYGVDRKIPESQTSYPEARDPQLDRGYGAPASVRLPDGDHQPG